LMKVILWVYLMKVIPWAKETKGPQQNNRIAKLS
jgi:hypothetical protein